MQRKRSSAPLPTKLRASAKKPPRRPASSAATDGRREELVLAAYELIADKGLEELRTRDIACKVGINISTLHYYFDTKEALVAAVVDHVTELFRRVREPLAEGATPVDELRHLFSTQRYRRRVEPRLDVVVQEMMLRGRRDERVRARLELMLLAWNGYVESLIERGVRSGDFARNVDAKLAAAIITSYLIGTNIQQGVRPTTFAFEAPSDALVNWLLPR